MYDNKNSYGISTFFVSQAYGSDTLCERSAAASGTENAPFRTVERALDAIAELRSKGVERPLTIAIVGDYYISAPIFLKNLHKLYCHLDSNLHH